MVESVSLPFLGPYERGAALDLLAAHAVPGVEEVDPEQGTVRRLLEVAGRLQPVQVRLAPDALELSVGDGPVTAALVARVRRWFDLDLDPTVLVRHLASDPRLGPAVRARPGLRVIGHPVPFEAAVATVLGQQVSLGAARTFAGRLVAAYGRPGLDGLRAFPEPATLAAEAPLDLQAAIGVTGARARTVHALATAVADGLGLDGPDDPPVPGPDVRTPDARDPDERAARLRAVPGIGPWTVSYLAVRAFGDRDAFPAGDLVLRRALGGVSARQAEALSQPWRPWRAYALVHLWRTVWP